MSPHHSGYIAAICTILTCSLFSFSLLCKISMVVLGVGWRACSWVIWHLVFFLSGWFSLRFIDAPGIYVLVFVLSVASLWGRMTAILLPYHHRCRPSTKTRFMKAKRRQHTGVVRCLADYYSKLNLSDAVRTANCCGCFE